ncbi:unnamed protein product [Leptidea sinapis]|uniref:FLYWCH-type domain-containing protein n=1 Tax=Leptidea sinapis TaxID=189913 RepID=A0A5E4PXB4_9NEOP|nr:unnamed protein product [Leptidea sinapis]
MARGSQRKEQDNLPIFGTTHKGNNVIMVGPYRFNRVSGYKGKRVRWACVKVRNGCRASITTLDDQLN